MGKGERQNTVGAVGESGWTHERVCGRSCVQVKVGKMRSNEEGDREAVQGFQVLSRRL